jgi:hypothetical protein
MSESKSSGSSGGSSGSSAPADTEERYTPEEWRTRARQVGVSRHAIAGALADAAPTRTLTLQQVKKKVDDFLKRKIEPPDAEDEE